ncbi:unnamed protein product [Didymodactylos carnosus]|uniref:Proteasome assembly chaperone 4 n=1 Tax=Didymodactylos carnosus TaxID=1234261 RepID=A0A813XG23_9BILA|nr:unnamed protein product [Didymodactylos carnosus]CAF0869588.1 unnamed protein product [Didymodactylos carnosus]CAF3570410.1 unnamed protein product [Didymodactylos carnosus]CAF3657002.1 unnamed protein product [Didymodactylos carnosus]
MSSLIDTEVLNNHVNLADNQVIQPIKEISGGINVSQFSKRISDSLVMYQIIRYPDRCLFIWIGTNGDMSLSNLAMTMPSMVPLSTSNNTNNLIGTTLFGGDFYEHSLSLSKKLTRRLNKQVYVSLNLPDENELLLREIESALIEHIRQNPDAY